MKFQIRRFVCGMVAVSGLAGCGGGPSGPPDDPNAFPFVQCTIKSAGKDVEGAVVGLYAKSGTSPKIVGRFDGESGAYRFGTMEGDKEKPGVPEGTYVVTVTPGRGSKVSIPGKYAKAQSSNLTLEVKKGDEAIIPLVLN
ncbi:hypothetical protein AYO47_05375 [Planctomyces sp. SCGC AG-212-M04]|nr:hypothetical protein AYO47_05375 [Planctomyces sp. SCGC AG-212-M04]